MKKIITLSILLAVYLITMSATLFAQPVVTSSMPQPPFGTVDSVYGGPASVVPGSGGAGVTWNLSTITTTLEGVATIVNPDSTPYASTFPTANFAVQVIPTGSSTSLYGYDRISSTLWEALSNNYSGPGTGTIFTDFESNVEFPFNYANSFIDTFQKTTGSPNTVTVTYDGYGTLITPFGTYSNVVRIKKYWGVGDYAYNWYSTTPYFFNLANYNATANSYTLIGNGTTSSTPQVLSGNLCVSIFPNPITDRAILKINGSISLKNAEVVLNDFSGRIIRQIPITTAETIIQRKELAPGIYCYRFLNDDACVAYGKIIVQ